MAWGVKDVHRALIWRHFEAGVWGFKGRKGFLGRLAPHTHFRFRLGYSSLGGLFPEPHISIYGLRSAIRPA